MENDIIKHGSFTHPLSVKLLWVPWRQRKLFLFLYLSSTWYMESIQCLLLLWSLYCAWLFLNKDCILYLPTIKWAYLNLLLIDRTWGGKYLKKKKKRLFKMDIPKSTEEGLPSNHLNNIYTKSNYTCWQISQHKSFPSSCKDQTR